MSAQAIMIIHLGNRENSDAVLKFVQELLERGDSLTILASSETASMYADFAVTVWPDGAPRGFLRLLALVRRISWAQFAEIHDFDASRRTKAYRWFVRPSPTWYLSSLVRVSGSTARSG
ncbi:MAG TPA: hypothetical protein DD437_12015 [Rhodobiaceae bacterium]|nr:hypothetical protein [Rhodobiaceae bacterium]